MSRGRDGTDRLDQWISQLMDTHRAAMNRLHGLAEATAAAAVKGGGIKGLLLLN